MNTPTAIVLVLIAAIGGSIMAKSVSAIAGDLAGDIFWGLLLLGTIIFVMKRIKKKE